MTIHRPGAEVQPPDDIPVHTNKIEAKGLKIHLPLEFDWYSAMISASAAINDAPAEWEGFMKKNLPVDF